LDADIDIAAQLPVRGLSTSTGLREVGLLQLAQHQWCQHAGQRAGHAPAAVHARRLAKSRSRGNACRCTRGAPDTTGGGLGLYLPYGQPSLGAQLFATPMLQFKVRMLARAGRATYSSVDNLIGLWAAQNSMPSCNPAVNLWGWVAWPCVNKPEGIGTAPAAPYISMPKLLHQRSLTIMHL
jgi:hypothetical protein